KAAIIRPGVTAIVAPQADEAMEVLLRRCGEAAVTPFLIGEVKPRDSPMSAGPALYRSRFCNTLPDGPICTALEARGARYENVCLGRRGRHQVANAATALALAEGLRKHDFAIRDEAIVTGVENARHAGRLELWDAVVPPILFDGAHNPAAA